MLNQQGRTCVEVEEKFRVLGTRVPLGDLVLALEHGFAMQLLQVQSAERHGGRTRHARTHAVPNKLKGSTSACSS
jgi:hypothetical protein